MSAPVARSALTPEPQPLLLPFLAATVAHGVVVTVLLGGGALLDLIWPKPPPFVPPEHMEVAVMMPKAKNRPDRATKAARDKGKAVKAERTKNAEPAPIRESDLSVPDPRKKVESKLDSKAPEKASDRAGDPNAARKAAIQRALLNALAEDAIEADRDQAATDKNGDPDAEIATAKAGARTDPEYARYIQQLKKLFRAGFHPLPTTYEGKKISATVHLEVDAAGGVTRFEIVKSSGNESYDAAAERAVQAVPKIPLPPDRYRALLAEGYDVDFPAPQ